MRISFALVLSVSLAVDAFAVAPQLWRVRTSEDFLAGEIDGFAVTSRGQMRPAPALTKLASFDDPFVLCQATAPNGDRFFGSGNNGKVYRLRGSELKLLYTATEPEVYAIAFHGGALYAGTSPNGKVYRIDPDDGKASAFFDPKQAYIWSLAFLPDGDLAVATGVEGKLFRVKASGQSKVLFDSPEAHIRALAVKVDGSILAGGSAKGRIYEIRGDGATHALYDSALNEIAAVYVDKDGIGWAAAVTNVLPTSAPAKPPQQPKAAGQQSTSSASSGSGGSAEKKEEPAANVEVTFGYDEQSTASSAQSGGAELYRINPDGFVETVRKLDREMIYAITGAPGGGVLLSTGPQGRIYRFRDGEVSLLGSVPEKQVVSISTNGTGTLITTTNSGAVYRMGDAPSPKAEFRSAVKDVERFSRFGHYRVEGNAVADGNVAIAFRSGNTRSPDTTWSPWSSPSTAPQGLVDAPAGRYVQWKLTTPKVASGVAIDSVTVGFINRNLAPAIDSVVVQDPAVIYITGSYPPSPQLVEATNPDEYGIFTSLDTPRGRNEPGKKVFRKGYRTVLWRAHDENSDPLRYSLYFRRKGNERWLRLRENLDETSMNFDTSQLPDGTYELRLVASDIAENPEAPLTDAKEAIEFLVDNTPPSISSSVQGDEVLIHVTDKLSPIGKVEYAADADQWVRLTPVDGISDSPDETYRLKRSAVQGKFVIVRATDAFYNVATESIEMNR